MLKGKLFVYFQNLKKHKILISHSSSYNYRISSFVESDSMRIKTANDQYLTNTPLTNLNIQQDSMNNGFSHELTRHEFYRTKRRKLRTTAYDKFKRKKQSRDIYLVTYKHDMEDHNFLKKSTFSFDYIY